MNTHGIVEEDDLILYAMQALSPAEMEAVGRRVEHDSQLASKLAEIQEVLGSYASASVDLEDAPARSLDRLLGAISPAPVAPVPVAPVPVAPAPPRAVTSAPERKPSWGLGWGLLWAGWAVAAMLLVALGLLYQGNHRAQQAIAERDAGLQSAQAQAAALTAERDRLQASLQQQSQQAEASQQEASLAKSKSDDLSAKAATLSAKVATSDQRAQQAAARADQLASAARDLAAERNQLGAALSHEQQVASSAAQSQQVLAALADPTALHVTLTVPKQKRRPSGRGTYLASNGTLVFTGSDLGPLPAGKVYELWLMPSDGAAPIPAGTFTPDSDGNATLISSRFQRVAAKGFAITVEKAGGSQTPTLPILLAGNA